MSALAHGGVSRLRHAMLLDTQFAYGRRAASSSVTNITKVKESFQKFILTLF